MNHSVTESLTLIVSVLTLLANWGTSRFYYGKLTQKVSDQGEVITKVEGKVDKITERVCHIEGAGSKGYVNGAAAGGAN